MCGTVECQEFSSFKEPMQVRDWRPSRPAVFSVDLAYETLNVGFMLMVFSNLFPARDNDLNERNLATKVGFACKQALKCQQPFADTLCIVKAVDAKNESLLPKTSANGITLGKCFGAQRSVCKSGEVYADRECSDFCVLSFGPNE